MKFLPPDIDDPSKIASHWIVELLREVRAEIVAAGGCLDVKIEDLSPSSNDDRSRSFVHADPWWTSYNEVLHLSMNVVWRRYTMGLITAIDANERFNTRHPRGPQEVLSVAERGDIPDSYAVWAPGVFTIACTGRAEVEAAIRTVLASPAFRTRWIEMKKEVRT